MRSTTIIGVDFSSAPSRRKPIVVAFGRLQGPAAAVLVLERFDLLPTLSDFDDWLACDRDWIGGFDLPFGLPADFIREQGWQCRDWPTLITRVASLTRPELIARCRAYADARPAGRKFAHRATDGPAGSSPSMKWVNPPVVLMLHAGAPRLLAAGLMVPAHRVAGGMPDASATGPAGSRVPRGERIALEAYPGLLARQLIGRASYKADDARRADPQRRVWRERIMAALAAGQGTGIAVRAPAALLADCCDDGRGDRLDAVLCAVQAAAAALRRDSGWGLPAGIDPLEGWIIGCEPQGLQTAATKACSSSMRG